VVLPGISGIELLHAIRAAAPRAPVIMMTGEPSVDTAAEALRSGAFDYLTKPVSKPTLLRAAGNAVKVKALDEERRRLQEAKERYQQELQAAVDSLTAANEQLRQAAAFREEVEQVARHDLKSPLSTLLFAPGLIKAMGGVLTAKQLSYLDLIESVGRRLLDMINRSLDLFKIEQGLYTFHPEALDLLRVAREVIGHEEALMRVRKLDAILLLDGRPAMESDAFVVSGEKMLCYSMLGNLLKNACEASPDGASVTLRFEHGETLSLSICNRGAVPECVRDRLFEKFSTSGKEHGTGLGTYSARLIAELHRARIAADTSVPDHTTVTVAFPAPSASLPG
jgi:two-component system, sensor histidine kinase and response regulator